MPALRHEKKPAQSEACGIITTMNETRLLMLRRLALAPMPYTSSELLTKLRALDTLIREDGRIPLELVEDHLEQSMANDFTSYEGSRCSSLAGQIMSYLDRCREADRREFPAEDPDSIAGPDYWPGPDDPFADLDAGDRKGLRDAWRARVMGEAGRDGWDPNGTPQYVATDDPDDDYDDAAERPLPV
jgi:hypothetical protein